MRYVRLYRGQLPNSCWNCDMRRFFKQLLKTLRSVWSRFGLTETTSPTPDKARPAVHPVEQAPSSNIGVREAPRNEPVKAESDHPAEESKGDELVEVVQVQRGGVVGDGEPDSTVAGRKTTATAVQQGQPIKNDDTAPQPLVHSGEAGGGGIESPPRPQDDHAQEGHASQAAVTDMKCDPTRQKPPLRNIETSAEPPLRSKETNDASGESDIADSTDDSKHSSRHNETDRETFTPPSALDRGTSDRSKDAADHLEDETVDAGDDTTDFESGEVNTLQTDEAQSHSSAPRPPDGQTVPTIEASKQRTANSDASISISRGNSNEDLLTREESIEEDISASVDVHALGAGDMDRPQDGDEDQESTQGDSRPPSLRRPTPAEDAREYVVPVQGISEVDREYARWNRAIVEQLLLSKPSSEEAYLCVNPRVLARVFEEGGLGLLSPEHAERQFSAAVANVYQKRVLRHRARLRVLRRCSGNDPPDCTAFLAGSVLAAFRMQTDEETSGNAYYRRLADLLGCETQGVHPVGFDPSVFESLWTYLYNWLHEVHGKRLATPRGDVGFRRFVALPLAHVPLRSLDVDKLPAFFSWAGYQPGGRVRHDRLLADLKQWQQSTNMLTPTGAGALSDDRSASVLAQVSAELESWDGSFCESPVRRSALVEIQFDIVQRKPLFFYLPRRPLGFPGIFDGGERVFAASDEGWYDPAKIRSEDGELLESGFEWSSNANGVHFTLRRSGAVVIPLTPSSNCSGFISSRRLLRGVRCSVLCWDGVLPTVKEYLSEVAQSSLNSVSHPLLPNGWSIFRDLSACVPVDAPTGLETLEVDPSVELIVAGGLRLGRRWSWLAGKPPRILVSGREAQDDIKVNGTSVEVGASGELLTGDVFSQPGEYLVEAGRVRRKIEIARPQMSVKEELKRIAPLDSHNLRIALPQGSWTLIGNSPDQISYSPAEFFRGMIASCPFQPSWAVQVGAGPGALVAAISYPSPPRSVDLQRLTGKNRKLVERWIGSIYKAHIRRPRFIGLNGSAPDDSIVDVWRQYTDLAKKIKRKLKRPR